MNIIDKLVKIFSVTALVFVAVSCHKDDDSDDYNYDDPRIHSFSISGISKTFVINDYDGTIYNYDSLSFNSDLNLHPRFSGYSVVPFIYYEKDGEWVKYSNSDDTQKLDFSNLVKIRSYSVDSTVYKDYTINIRVHKYDIESYQWNKLSELPVANSVISQKCLEYNSKYFYFYTTQEKSCFMTCSSDLKSWSSPTKIAIDNVDWSTLTLRQNELCVLLDNDLYVSSNGINFIKSESLLPSGFTLIKSLFTLNNTFFVIAKDEADTYLCKYSQNNYEAVTKLSSSFPVDDFVTTTSPSGLSTIGYVLGKGENGGTSVFAIDELGNVIDVTEGKSPFDYRNGMTVFYYADMLCVTGGKDSSDEYCNKIYQSSDGGITWVYDEHKIMPSEISNNMNSSIILDEANNYIYCVGGIVNGELSNSVWSGVLKQFILDDLTYGTIE